MEHLLTTTTAIAIAIVKRPQDWQRIVHTRQYHVPVRHVTRIMQSQWVALYLPSWHTEHPYCIRHIARMSAMSIAPRHTYLPDELDNPRANQLYAILTFDAIYRLRIPIHSTRWRRMTIHHTTWGTLARIDDLGTLTRIARQTATYHADVDAVILDNLLESYEWDTSTHDNLVSLAQDDDPPHDMGDISPHR